VAEALRYQEDLEPVFKQLCRIYDGALFWNQKTLNELIQSKYSLTAWLSIDDDGIQDIKILRFLETCKIFAILLLGISPLSILAIIYIGSILVRTALRIVDIRCNLKWYAPLYIYYDFLDSHEQQLELLINERIELEQTADIVRDYIIQSDERREKELRRSQKEDLKRWDRALNASKKKQK
jgi:hypothetical protein